MTPPLVHPSPDHLEAVAAVCGYAALVPTTVDPLRAYALVTTTSVEHGGGIYWTADLYRHRQKVMIVENRGDGGPNWYYDPAGGNADPTELAALRAATAEAFGGDDDEDLAITFLDVVATVASELV